MSIQTADLNMIGYSCEETITLSCGLMNIGRGICSVTIKPSINMMQKCSGSLNIEINRPYMKAILELNDGIKKLNRMQLDLQIQKINEIPFEHWSNEQKSLVRNYKKTKS